MNNQGVDRPNFTAVPNVLLDNMFNFTDSEWRIVMFICRQTFGWQRDATKCMSINFICGGTGLSRQGVINGCVRLIEKGLVTREPDGQSYAYKLLVNAVDQSTTLTRTSQPSRPELVNVVDPKKERKEKETKPLELPAVLQTEQFKAAWSDWLAYRRERRLTLTDSTIRAQISKLAGFGHDGAIASIRKSIESGWQGLFEANRYSASNPLPQAKLVTDPDVLVLGRLTFTRHAAPQREQFQSEDTWRTYLTEWRKKFGGDA